MLIPVTCLSIFSLFPLFSYPCADNRWAKSWTNGPCLTRRTRSCVSGSRKWKVRSHRLETSALRRWWKSCVRWAPFHRMYNSQPKINFMTFSVISHTNTRTHTRHRIGLFETAVWCLSPRSIRKRLMSLRKTSSSCRQWGSVWLGPAKRAKLLRSSWSSTKSASAGNTFWTWSLPGEHAEMFSAEKKSLLLEDETETEMCHVCPSFE